ncbi:hypothetical protein E2C01_096551 [Portunus trituberculatus]|uniref:Uncharacterized protein n=1 Tax=Portunus trituberculatus TaxID=210409 RepID=A0A5B7K214_PORTR|nr:hypothetical protein [Portunus trituberculatus]
MDIRSIKSVAEEEEGKAGGTAEVDGCRENGREENKARDETVGEEKEEIGGIGVFIEVRGSEATCKRYTEMRMGSGEEEASNVRIY